MRTRLITQGFYFCLALLLCALPTFGAQKFPDYPLRQAGDYGISSRQDDVTIGLDPVEAVPEQMTYFHTALSTSGFLPVFVVIHNASKADSLLLNKADISYASEGSGDGPKETTAGEKASIVGVSAIPYVGILLAVGLVKNASEVKQNLILRELQSRTLSPGETMSGFLYIAVPKKGPRAKLHIQFPIAWSGSDKRSDVSFDF